MTAPVLTQVTVGKYTWNKQSCYVLIQGQAEILTLQALCMQFQGRLAAANIREYLAMMEELEDILHSGGLIVLPVETFEVERCDEYFKEAS